MHPLYGHAARLVGQPVYIYHAQGRVYHGVLQSVIPTGIWINLCDPNPTPAGGPVASVAPAHATLDATLDSKVAPVFFPAAFFAFGALFGLAAASLAYPYYW